MIMRCITTVDARFLCDMLSLLYYKHLTADDLSSVAWRTALRYFFAEKKTSATSCLWRGDCTYVAETGACFFKALATEKAFV